MAPGRKGKTRPAAKEQSDGKVKVGNCESITVLKDKPKAEEAMALLKKIATLVAPIMRKHNWTLPLLCEFFPDQTNLLGMNYGGGLKIFIRLRPADAPDTFYDLESSLIGTMLHELTHNVHGPHDAKFYKFLDALQDEYDALRTGGYSGEGFLSEGNRVGKGVAISDANVPLHVARERALASAAKRAQLEAVMGTSGGRKLGGTTDRKRHPREILAEAAERRMRDQKTCRAGEHVDVAAVAAQAEASAAPIVLDISDEDEEAAAPIASTSKITSSDDSDIEIISAPAPRKPAAAAPPKATPAKRPASVTAPPPRAPPARPPDDIEGFTCHACTFHNANPLGLQCEICATLRPLVDVDGWLCHVCGSRMEHLFWTCATCHTVKTSSEASVNGIPMIKSSAALH